jgi:DNA repair protein RadC
MKKIAYILIFLFLFSNLCYAGEIQDRLEKSIRYRNIECLAVVYYRGNMEISGDLLTSNNQHKLWFFPSMILNKAINLQTNKVILIHNHPNKICEASELDIKTKNFVINLFDKENITVQFFVITRYEKIEYLLDR